ncbi:MAG: tetratricopeptide repeat protein [Candidatus Zixiibacteriota bacterium]|nr:MAG: tetratricopeptide repeat protein [candidate division Zixibacteria bacterium]
MEQSAKHQRGPFNEQRESDYGIAPIGDSAPPPPPAPVDEYPAEPETARGQDGGTTERVQPDESDSQQVKKLSDEEIKRIEQNLYGKDFLKGNERNDLASKIDAVRNDAPPTAEQSPAGADGQRTEKQPASFSRPHQAKSRSARRGQGIAYYYRNYLQLLGNRTLMTGDVLKVGEREYVLKPKKIKPAFLIGTFAVVLVIVLVTAASLLTSGSSSEGHLVGVILDGSDRPYIQGAEIRLPELGKSVETDARGFFDAGFLPVGTHRIEYVIDGTVVEIEHASVSPGEVRMVFLRPATEEELDQWHAQTEPEPPVSQPEPQRSAQKEPEAPARQATRDEPVKSPAARTSTVKSSPAKTTAYAKITLKANVDGARFELDGSILGAGNLTYSRIKAGRHRYRVSADGYNPVEGAISLSGGETRRLEVTLSRMNQSQKTASYSTDDFFYSGHAALQSGDYETAVADLTRGIDAKPSHAQAYFYRGEAYAKQKYVRKAHDDFVRAAEIYQIGKEYGRAITAYRRAIECDDKSVVAYIGRGNTYLKKGEELAAIGDFDKAARLDKRCFEAYYGMGEARFKQQQYKKAIDNFKDARSVNDKDIRVHQYLMLSYMALADYKNVKKSYEKFADIATDEQMNRFNNDRKYSAVLRVLDSH